LLLLKVSLAQLCPTCDPVKGFVQSSLSFQSSKIVLHTVLTICPVFDNIEFYIFDAGGPQWHFITSVTIAVRIQTLAVY